MSFEGLELGEAVENALGNVQYISNEVEKVNKNQEQCGRGA